MFNYNVKFTKGEGGGLRYVLETLAITQKTIMKLILKKETNIFKNPLAGLSLKPSRQGLWVY